MSKSKVLSAFHAQAWELLNETWKSVNSIEDIKSARNPDWSGIFEEILFYGGSTYPYILITQILGKSTDSTLNALCLQDSSTLDNAWDARSLASKVVIQWNKDIGRALPGGNNDPYVNNPARYKNFGEEMSSKAKDKKGYSNLLAVMTYLQDNDGQSALLLLSALLIEIRFHLENNSREYLGPARVSVEDVMNTLNVYLSEKSNGVRLQVLTYALFKTFSECVPGYGSVRSYPTNSSDMSSGRAGDVEIIQNDHTNMAIEVKDRILTFDDLESSILKCRAAKVDNLLFVIQANEVLLAEEDRMIARARHEFSRGINVNFCGAAGFFNEILKLLNPEQLSLFLQETHAALEELGAHLKHRNRWMDLVKAI